MKCMVVLGTRPEAIKLAPVIRVLKQHDDMDCIVCVTGQHRQMLDHVLQLFEIRPDYDLAVMQVNQDVFDVTANVLIKMRAVLKQVQPDVVIVQGDTTTCMVAALAAFYVKIPVAHVEAGLRTHQLYSPFPEEMNRSLVSKIATWHFAPTQRAADNLIREGISQHHIWVTGNTVIDALLWMVEKLKHDTNIVAQQVKSLVALNRPIILITGHRRESFGQGLHNICTAILQLAQQHPDWLFIYPVHLNPNVLGPVHELLSGHENIYLIEPLEYASFVYLMNACKLIISDSGGIQEEAPSLGKPVLVTREVTERSEAIESGTVVLVGTDKAALIKNVKQFISNPSAYSSIDAKRSPFGSGDAAEKIVQKLAWPTVVS